MSCEVAVLIDERTSPLSDDRRRAFTLGPLEGGTRSTFLVETGGSSPQGSVTGVWFEKVLLVGRLCHAPVQRGVHYFGV